MFFFFLVGSVLLGPCAHVCRAAVSYDTPQHILTANIGSRLSRSWSICPVCVTFTVHSFGTPMYHVETQQKQGGRFISAACYGKSVQHYVYAHARAHVALWKKM